ncbi:MAG: EthD domain-containing protein [Candidatus Brocadiia bacterium]
MIKLVFCLKRLPGLSVEDFHSYWRNIHAPLVVRHKCVLKIRRYVQFHTSVDALTDRLRGFRQSPEPYDGIAEIWYESRDALVSLGRDPDAKTASRELREDEARFVDLSASPIWIGEDVPIIS